MRVSDIMKKLSSPPSPIVWPKDNPVAVAPPSQSPPPVATEEPVPGAMVGLPELEAAAELVSAAIDLQGETLVDSPLSVTTTTLPSHSHEAIAAIQDVVVPQNLEPAIEALVSALRGKIEARPMAPPPQVSTAPLTNCAEMTEAGAGECLESPAIAVAPETNDMLEPIAVPAYVCVNEASAPAEPLPVSVPPVSVVPENGSAGNVEGGMWKDGDAMLRHLWQTVEDFLQKVRVGQQPNPHAVIETADILIESLKRNDDLVKVLFVKKESGDLASRLIDVAIVAGRIGFSLGYETSKLQELVLCALLHDVGMLKVPEGIVNKKGKLDDSELEEIRKHPQYGMEILKNIPGLPPVVAEAAYQEQEREDGSGYPQGLRGGSIHEYAKIIGLAVLFTAMLQPRPQRARRIPFEIIKEIIDHNKAQFPLYLIRILIDELSLFPEGLYVTLNTGEIGRVLRTSRLAPMRPVIEIVRDVHGRQPREPREYDLMKEQILRIEDALFEIT